MTVVGRRPAVPWIRESRLHQHRRRIAYKGLQRYALRFELFYREARSATKLGGSKSRHDSRRKRVRTAEPVVETSPVQTVSATSGRVSPISSPFGGP